MASVGHKKKVTNAMRRIFGPDNTKDHQNNNPDGTDAVAQPAANNNGKANNKTNHDVGGTGAAGANAAGPSSASAASASVQSPFKRRCGIAPAPTDPKPIHCAIVPLPVNVNAPAVADANKNHNKNTHNKGTAMKTIAGAVKPAGVVAAVAAVAAAAAVIKKPHNKAANHKPNASSKAAALRSTAEPVERVPEHGTWHANIMVPAVDQSIRARRLMKEFGDIQRMMMKPNPVFTVDLQNENLFEWNARLHVIDPDSPLAADMREQSVKYIMLRLSFPDNFPFAPPFMYVVAPRIEKGFVMEGGAICMELLTPRGWASAYTVEALLMQFAASVVKGHGRLLPNQKQIKPFSRSTAEQSFKSLVRTHDKYGWVTPSLADG